MTTSTFPLKLVEYPYNGSAFISGGTLVFDPAPQSIEKNAKVEWLARQTGLYSIYPRAKYRYRRTIEFSLKGGCTTDKRKEIEFYSMRYSKFKMDSTWGRMSSPEYYSDRNTNPSGHPWNPDNPGQVLYVMFTECNFTLEEGKDWASYTIKLTVVNLEGIS